MLLAYLLVHVQAITSNALGKLDITSNGMKDCHFTLCWLSNTLGFDVQEHHGYITLHQQEKRVQPKSE